MELFQTAKPVFLAKPKNQWNQFAGFRTDIEVEKETVLTFRIAARSFYRLYINGEMRAHGPARTGKGYVRQDVLTIKAKGFLHVAVEVAAYNKPLRYSNDITCEPGMLCMEIEADNEIICATGAKCTFPVWVTELTMRRERVELLSHCRQIIEVYDLDEESLQWTTNPYIGEEGYEEPALISDPPKTLIRRAPYPDYRRIPFTCLMKAGDVTPDGNAVMEPMLPESFHKDWYESLPDPVIRTIKERDKVFTGRVEQGEKGITLIRGQEDPFLQWDLKEPAVGFLELAFETEEDAVVDIFHNDALEADGGLHDCPNLIRYQVKKGSYSLCTYEPYLFKYLKVVFRNTGKVKNIRAQVCTYWYPVKESGTFACSDPVLNRIFKGALKTLQSNTLDIFMDCPERERGGWLCDSTWTARAAYMMLGDLRVEKDFMENFFNTSKDDYENALFPEVYPGHGVGEGKSCGISTWSFWLLIELCEYLRRSGDEEFLLQVKRRVEEFVTGMEAYENEAGLLEGLPNVFIDWSAANDTENTQPISVPANAVYAYMLIELGKTYQEEAWEKKGRAMQETLRTIAPVPKESCKYPAYPDAVVLEDGQLKGKNNVTEAAMFWDIWAELYTEENAAQTVEAAVNRMGTHPRLDADERVAKAELFIGLCIRHDMLAKLSKYDILLDELRGVYGKEMEEGPGTLYEQHYREDIRSSRNHGFGSHAGVLLMREYLGLGEPDALNHTVRIAPHPCGLTWASGKVSCQGQDAFVFWQADYENKIFTINISMPEGWKPVMDFSGELEEFEIRVNQ